MSSVPAVLAALTALGSATLPDRQVINGGTDAEPITRERFLLVGDEEFDIEEDFDSMSTETSSEQYVVPCTAGADLSGTDPMQATAAAFADYRTFRQAVLQHPSGHTLGLEADGVISVLPVGTRRFVRRSDQNGKHAVVRFGFRVYAQTS